MSRTVWAAVGTRIFEAGVDHGMLYISGVGYPWSGLVSVKEETTGADLRSHYVDGIKYAERYTLEEFGMTIEAYTYPEEFALCDGTKSLGNGLFVTQQRRKTFGFSYRTKVGDDIRGLDLGYKIHLVYNCLAAPSPRDNKTLDDKVEPFNFSWKVTTRAPVLDFVPTAHFEIDSRTTPDGLLSYIEDILYGSDQQSARMPTAAELAFIFTSYSVVDYDAGDPDDVVYYSFDGGDPIQGNVTTILDGGTVTGGDASQDASNFYVGGTPAYTVATVADGGTVTTFGSTVADGGAL